jgi:hypothetical protein
MFIIRWPSDGLQFDVSVCFVLCFINLFNTAFVAWCCTSLIHVFVFCHCVMLVYIAGFSSLVGPPNLMVTQVQTSQAGHSGSSLPLATDLLQASFVSSLAGGVQGSGHGLGVGMGVAHGGTFCQVPVTGECGVPVY